MENEPRGVQVSLRNVLIAIGWMGLAFAAFRARDERYLRNLAWEPSWIVKEFGFWGSYWLSSLCVVAALWSLFRRPAIPPLLTIPIAMFAGFNVALIPWFLGQPLFPFLTFPFLAGPAALIDTLIGRRFDANVFERAYLISAPILYGFYAYLLFVRRLGWTGRTLLIMFHMLCGMIAAPLAYALLFGGAN